MVADFRELFSVSVWRVSVREYVELVRALLQDPRSRLASKLAGWDHPVTRDSAVLMDLFDLLHQANSKRRPKPYPRPWAAKKKTKLGGKRLVRRSAADVRAILRPETAGSSHPS